MDGPSEGDVSTMNGWHLSGTNGVGGRNGQNQWR
jgi:hypothetical protein